MRDGRDAVKRCDHDEPVRDDVQMRSPICLANVLQDSDGKLCPCKQKDQKITCLSALIAAMGRFSFVPSCATAQADVWQVLVGPSSCAAVMTMLATAYLTERSAMLHQWKIAWHKGKVSRLEIKRLQAHCFRKSDSAPLEVLRHCLSCGTPSCHGTE